MMEAEFAEMESIDAMPSMLCNSLSIGFVMLVSTSSGSAPGKIVETSTRPGGVSGISR